MESKWSMSPKSTCCCISLEQACFIYSIINIVVVSAGLVASSYYLAWDIKYNHSFFCEFDVLFDMILCIFIGIFFIFSGLLCYGVYKKKAVFLKAYFIATIVEILIILGPIAFFFIFSDNIRVTKSSVVGVVICIIYGFSLILVQRTHVVLSKNAILSSGHAKLVNEYPIGPI